MGARDISGRLEVIIASTKFASKSLATVVETLVCTRVEGAPRSAFLISASAIKRKPEAMNPTHSLSRTKLATTSAAMNRITATHAHLVQVAGRQMPRADASTTRK